MLAHRHFDRHRRGLRGGIGDRELRLEPALQHIAQVEHLQHRRVLNQPHPRVLLREVVRIHQNQIAPRALDVIEPVTRPGHDGVLFLLRIIARQQNAPFLANRGPVHFHFRQRNRVLALPNRAVGVERVHRLGVVRDVPNVQRVRGGGNREKLCALDLVAQFTTVQVRARDVRHEPVPAWCVTGVHTIRRERDHDRVLVVLKINRRHHRRRALLTRQQRRTLRDVHELVVVFQPKRRLPGMGQAIELVDDAGHCRRIVPLAGCELAVQRRRMRRARDCQSHVGFGSEGRRGE